jgi:hypothetical protein
MTVKKQHVEGTNIKEAEVVVEAIAMVEFRQTVKVPGDE